MLFIVGMPRSGTTWLAKIFDSHPRVLYRHEPDIARRPAELPVYCPPDQVERYLPQAKSYLSAALAVRNTRTVGTRPLFEKEYRTRLAHTARAGLILGIKTIERIDRLSAWARRVSVPDLVRPGTVPALTVFKSVNALGHLNLLMRASPGARAVLIVRHPCGHVASILRGQRLGKFESGIGSGDDLKFFQHLALTPEAECHRLDTTAFRGMTSVERLAWRWALSNDKAMADFADDHRLQVVRYEDLCADPMAVARALFAATGLDWSDRSERFVAASTESCGEEAYYGLQRDPARAAGKWREELTAEDAARVLGVAARTTSGRLFLDPAQV